jgi:prepilin-type N-terminal cleavage/methylation domain-containing protein
MKKRGFTMLEVLIAVVIFVLALGAVVYGFDALSRQSKVASASLSQIQEALLLMETARMELASMVVNPVAFENEHLGNSFVISKPYGSSIQFVTERTEGGAKQRYLVYYEARNSKPGDAMAGLILKKQVWKFQRQQTWLEQITFPAGWPADWIGPLVETQESRYRDLNLYDMRWQCLVPDQNEGRVFIRMKMILRMGKGNFLPLTTLVAFNTPEDPGRRSDCPSLFSLCFKPKPKDKEARDCYCSGGKKPPKLRKKDAGAGPGGPGAGPGGGRP